MSVLSKILEKLLIVTVLLQVESWKGTMLQTCCGTVISVLDYIQLDAKVIPDDLTCTQLLEQCHVPRNPELDEPILYNDVVFKRASYKKSESGKKQKKLKTSNNIVEVVIPLKTIFLNSYVRKYISLFFQRV